MLTSLKNGRSLTFYQQVSVKRNEMDASSASGILAVPISGASFSALTVTNGYNTQFGGFLEALNAERSMLADKVANGMAKNPAYVGARNDGVSLAWDYEAADIKMGGNGSANWNAAEQQEILENRPDIVNKPKIVDGKMKNPKGGVRGAEGHHQKNVADHPEEQANPDNIKFYKNRKQHLEEGHDGNWKNECDGPMNDKNKMLEKTNAKRVFRNELRGLGLAVAIGAGVGLTIGFVSTLAQMGITPDTLKLAAAESIKSGVESGLTSAVGYGVGRTIGELASQAVSGMMESAGVAITENLSKMIHMGAAGTLTIAVFSAYQFMKLKLRGAATKDALIQTGKHALFSLSLLAVSIAAQGIWGGAAGMIVSVSIGIIIICYSAANSVYQRHFSEKIRVYTIEKCYPSFLV